MKALVCDLKSRHPDIVVVEIKGHSPIDGTYYVEPLYRNVPHDQVYKHDMESLLKSAIDTIKRERQKTDNYIYDVISQLDIIGGFPKAIECEECGLMVGIIGHDCGNNGG